MLNRKSFSKLIGWPLVAAVPLFFAVDHAYAKVGVASVVNGEPRSKQPNEVERILHIGNDMPAEAKNAIPSTQEKQNNVHTSEANIDLGQVFGAGPLEGNSPLQGAGPMQGEGPQQGEGPLQTAGPLENSGPLQSSGPLQAAGPLQNSGPLDAASPLQQTGPVNGQLALNLGGTPFGGTMPNITYTEAEFLPIINGIRSGDTASLQQLQTILSTPEGTSPNTLNNIVNAMTSTSSPTPYSPPTVMPPVIYNPGSSSSLSPN